MRTADPSTEFFGSEASSPATSIEGLQADEAPPTSATSSRAPREYALHGFLGISLVVHLLVSWGMPTAAPRVAETLEQVAFEFIESDATPETSVPPPEVAPEPPPPVAPAAAPIVPERARVREPRRPLEPTPEAPETPAPAADAEPVAPAAAPILGARRVASGGDFAAGHASGSVHGIGSVAREGAVEGGTSTRPSAEPAVDIRALMLQYVRSLQGRVQTNVRYPRTAIAAGLEGVVRVGLTIDQNGRVIRTRVRRSSGHPSLDAAALAAAERLSTVPAPPASLRDHFASRPQELTLPIRLRLQR